MKLFFISISIASILTACLILMALNKLPETDMNQLITTSGDDVIICMRGKIDKLVYINGHLFDCVPMADHRSVKLYLRGK